MELHKQSLGNSPRASDEGGWGWWRGVRARLTDWLKGLTVTEKRKLIKGLGQKVNLDLSDNLFQELKI